MHRSLFLGKTRLRATLVLTLLGCGDFAFAQSRPLEYQREGADRSSVLSLRDDLSFSNLSDTDGVDLGLVALANEQRRSQQRRGLEFWDDGAAGAPVFTRPGMTDVPPSSPRFDPMIMTRKVLIGAPSIEVARATGSQVGAWRVTETVSANHFMLRFRTFAQTWTAAQTLRDLGVWSNIQFKRRVLVQQIPPEFLPDGFPSPDDPLLPEQWHLVNTGQGIGIPGIIPRRIAIRPL